MKLFDVLWTKAKIDRKADKKFFSNVISAKNFQVIEDIIFFTFSLQKQEQFWKWSSFEREEKEWERERERIWPFQKSVDILYFKTFL